MTIDRNYPERVAGERDVLICMCVCGNIYVHQRNAGYNCQKCNADPTDNGSEMIWFNGTVSSCKKPDRWVSDTAMFDAWAHDVFKT